MANFLQTLVLQFFLPSPSSLHWLTRPVRSQGKSTSFTYDFYGDRTDLTHQGDTHFPSDSTYLRLTGTNPYGAPRTYSVGQVVHSSPVLFQAGGAHADFETTLQFRITVVDDTPSDGLTFLVAPVGHNIPDGSTGGNFGIFNPSGTTPSAVAVEFDTLANRWDPSYRHVGIDIESSSSSNVTRVDGTVVGQEVTARIS